MTPSHTRARALLLALATLALIGLPSLPAAQAHSLVLKVSPEDGSVLAAVPSQVSITLNEAPIAASAHLSVRGPQGPLTVVTTVTGTTILGAVTAPAQASGPGTYTLDWRLAGGDGHVITGSTAFRVTAAAGATAAATANTVTATANTATANTATVSTGATADTGASSPTPGDGASPSPSPSSTQKTSGTPQPQWALWVAAFAALVAAVWWVRARSHRSASPPDRTKQG